jgi:hypothetical protein
MRTQTRTLTDHEAALLRAMLGSRREAIESGLMFLLLALGGSLLPFLLLQRTVPWFDQHLGLIAVTLTGCSAYALWRHRRGLPAAHVAATRNDLALGLVDDSHYEIVEALLVEEEEDEGPGYYLKLAGGQALFLQGQYLMAAEEEGFPRAHLRIARARESRSLVSFHCDGPRVPVTGRLAPFGVEDWKAERVPDDGSLLELDFEALKRRASAMKEDPR